MNTIKNECMENVQDLGIKVYKEEDGGYYAEISAFPWCFSSGETLEELEKNLTEALESHLISLQKDLQDHALHISQDAVYA